ncbi:hypothetical protein CI109_101501 [Kwoniella shandongensis]|uniref:Uncharacterized protein n=1 Tax=Kwoniella shandongensis TaxID=1734106 RepID=A0A5M6C3W5_9TREE|nr:uncharacterized protein CI109_001906 [Kwoniella shandongensis]KAA5529481.1 hypothetical protein CI109_001906 [Kwoniella shandongensis]
MLSDISLRPSLSLSLLVGLISFLGVQAQDQDGTTPYPDWITNDYDCVMGCLSGFNDTITTIPRPDLQTQAFSCSSGCQGVPMGNYYQTLYYIQLFYATGSIYEWSDSAPDGYKHATFTSDPDADAAQSASAAETAWSSADSNDAAPTGVAAVATDGDDGDDAVSASPSATDSGVSTAGGEGLLPGATASVIGTPASSTNGIAPAVAGNLTSNGEEIGGNATGGTNATSGAGKTVIAGLGGGIGMFSLAGVVVGLATTGLSGLWVGL